MLRTSFGRALGAAAFVLTAAAPAAAQQLPPAAQIVAKYVDAIGGRAAWSQHTARHVVAEMSMPAMGMTMNMEMFFARPNKMLTRMNMNGMAMTGGYDGQVAWSNNPMQGPRILTGPELRQVTETADFDASVDLPRLFPTMETIGERTVNGRACWNVRMVSAGGTETKNCFDKETGLLIGSQSKQTTQMGQMDADVTFEDYRDFGGVKMPTKTTMSVAGQQMVTTIKSVSFEAIPDATFALPAEVRALPHP